MSIITQKRTWNKIQVKIETNNETAEVEVYAIGSGLFGIDELLASSQGKGNDWVVNNPQSFANVFNRRNNTNSTKEEVQKAFLTEGYKVFDNDRAAVLNNPDNYSNPQVAVTSQTNFFNAGTPRLKNPVTQQQVSSQGQQSTQQTTATTKQPQPQTASQPVKPQPAGSPTDTGTTETGSSGGSNVVPDGNGAQQSELPADPNNNNGKGNINSTGNGAPLLLRYPLSNLDEVGRELGISYDFIKIQIKEYSQSLDPSIFGSNVQSENIINSVTNRSAGGKGNAIATIILPMMQTMSTSNSVDWGADKANIFQLVGGAMAANFFGRVGNEGVNPQLLKDTFNKLVGAGGAFAKGSVQEKNAITGILAGYLVGAPNIATRATGKVINPNMEMLFSGPRLRTFNFQFDMTPRNKDESKQIRRIIKTFKQYMSPSKSATGAFLQSPKIFELEYIYNGNIQSGPVNGNQHPYLNKFKACALTEFNVNFTPDGSYMTYRDDGSMTKYSITMSFSEISPIFEGDYDGKDDMGF